MGYKFRVYDMDGKDVTDERDWYIDKYGDLLYECEMEEGDLTSTAHAQEGYRYEWEG